MEEGDEVDLRVRRIVGGQGLGRVVLKCQEKHGEGRDSSLGHVS